MGHPSLNSSQHRIVKASRRDAACRISVRVCTALICSRRRGKPRLYGMHCPEPFLPLGGYPITVSRNFRCEGAILVLQVIEEFSPVASELPFCFLRAESWELRAVFHR